MVERGGGDVQQETYMYWATPTMPGCSGSYCIHLILFHSQSISHTAVIPSAQLRELRPTEVKYFFRLLTGGVRFKP